MPPGGVGEFPELQPSLFSSLGKTGGLSDEFLNHSGAVAMPLDFNSGAFEQREPCVAQRGSLGHDQIVPKFDSGAAAGDDGGAVLQRVGYPKVTPEYHRAVIKESAAVGFVRGFQAIQ